MTPVLEFRRVCGAGFEGLSFTLFAGEFLTLRAASGPAVLDLAGRHVPPARGTVLLCGRDIWLGEAQEVRGLVADLRPAPAELGRGTADWLAARAPQLLCLRLPERADMQALAEIKALCRDAQIAVLALDPAGLADGLADRPLQLPARAFA